jgi:arylamine N-acetyltransferase
VHGEWQPYFRYELGLADEGVREAAYQRHHTPGQSWVVDRLRLVTCSPDQVLALDRGELVRYTDGTKEARPVLDPAAVAARVFNWPGLPIQAALRALDDR